MTRIFISHSSDDQQLAAAIVDLLRSALNIPAESIRCTSVDGHRLSGGAETDRMLRTEIRECDVFIGLISASSVDSAYVLFELGARWGADRYLLPLVAPGGDKTLLRGPLAGLNALRCDSAAEVHQAVTEIAEVLETTIEKAATYHRHIEQIRNTSSAARTTRVQALPPGATQAAARSAPLSDAYADANAVIERHCEREWPDNYSMRAFCIEQQEQALAELRQGAPSGVPEEVFRNIRERAAAEWPSNFSMRAFKEEQEIDAYQKLRRREPT